MNRKEVALLLAMVCSFDRRTVGESEVIAWHAVLDDVQFEEAKQAVVAHFRDSRDWLMPADIRRLARQQRQDTAVRRPAIDSTAIRQTDPPPVWHETRKALAARPRTTESFATAMHDMAVMLEQRTQQAES